MSSFELTFEDFKKSVANLKQAISDFNNTDKENVFFVHIKNSMIKTFELTFDLAWKSLQKKLAADGTIANSPKGAFAAAIADGIIKEDVAWINLVQMRNLSVHTYEVALADELLITIPQHVTYFDELVMGLSGK